MPSVTSATRRPSKRARSARSSSAVKTGVAMKPLPARGSAARRGLREACARGERGGSGQDGSASGES